MTRLWVLLAVVGCGPSLGVANEEPPTDPILEVSGEQLFTRGVALARQGDLIRSEQYLSAAISRGAPTDRVLPLLLRVCVEGSRLQAALAYAREELGRHPENWSLRYVVASLQRALGRLEAAEANLLRVIERVPEEANPHYLLAMVRRELGLRDHARSHLNAYLDLAPSGDYAASAEEALRDLDTARPPTSVEDALPMAPRRPDTDEGEETAPRTDPSPELSEDAEP